MSLPLAVTELVGSRYPMVGVWIGDDEGKGGKIDGYPQGELGQFFYLLGTNI